MPIQVKAPDGTIAQFPDGMADADIEKVMAQHYPQQAPSFGQKLSSAVSGLTQAPYDLLQSGIELGARGLDAVGATQNAFPKTKQFFDQSNRDAAVIAGGDPNSGQYKAGRIAGQVVATAPVAGLNVLKGVPLLANLPRLAAAGDAAIQGASAAAATSNSSDAPLGQQLGTGAALGAATPVVAGAASRVISPVIDKGRRALLDAGVPLTIGQTLGGVAKTIEDKVAGTVPFVGDMVNNARRNAVVGFNNAVLNSALKPIGQSLPKSLEPGRASVDYVADKIGERYDNLLPRMTGQIDQPLVQDLNGIVQNMVGEGAAPETITRFQNVIKAQLSDRAPTGDLTGEALKTAQGELGRIGRKYAASQNLDDQVLGHAILDAHGSFNQMLERNNPGFADQLKAVNTAFAQYARIRKAAGAVGSKDGVFSAPQYANAVKSADGSAGKGNYARGKAYMQDLSDAANQVLPSSVPDSGTAGRLALTALGVGGAGMAGHAVPLVGPYALPAAAGLAAGAGLYSRPAQAVLRAAVTKRPAWAPAVAAAVDRNGILAAPGLASILAGAPLYQLPQQ